MTKIAEILHRCDLVEQEVELEGMETYIAERFCYLAGLRQKIDARKKELTMLVKVSRDRRKFL